MVIKPVFTTVPSTQENKQLAALCRVQRRDAKNINNVDIDFSV